METIKVAIYQQYHTRAGDECVDLEMIERESDDIEIYEGTPADLVKEALEELRITGDMPYDSNVAYRIKAARTLLEAAEALA